MLKRWVIKIKKMATALNQVQLEILKLFRRNQSEQDLKEIKSLLVAYLSDKVTREADAAFDRKEYTLSVFEDWKKEHFRKVSQ